MAKNEQEVIYVAIFTCLTSPEHVSDTTAVVQPLKSNRPAKKKGSCKLFSLHR